MTPTIIEGFARVEASLDAAAIAFMLNNEELIGKSVPTLADSGTFLGIGAVCDALRARGVDETEVGSIFTDAKAALDAEAKVRTVALMEKIAAQSNVEATRGSYGNR